MSERLSFTHEVACGTAQRRNHIVHKPGSGVKELRQDADNHDRRKEVRCIGNRLNRLLEQPTRTLIERQRQQDRHRETRQKAVNAQRQRIPKKLCKRGRAENLIKLKKTNPLAFKNALPDGIIFKSDDQTSHRHIAKKDQIHQRQRKHQI